MKMTLFHILFVYFTPAITSTAQKLQLYLLTNDFVTSSMSVHFKAKIIYDDVIKKVLTSAKPL